MRDSAVTRRHVPPVYATSQSPTCTLVATGLNASFPSTPLTHAAIVDLQQLGWDGVEPSYLRAVRERLISDEPDLWQMIHQDDPLMKDMLENPAFATLEPDDMLAFIRGGW